MITILPSVKGLLLYSSPLLLLAIAFAWHLNETVLELVDDFLPTSQSQQIRVSAASSRRSLTDSTTTTAAPPDHSDTTATFKTDSVKRVLSIIDVAEFASTVDNSYCGLEQHPTNISQVAANFGLLEPYTLEYQSHKDDTYSFFRTIAVPFQAYDSNGTKRTLGGDEFFVTISGWSTDDNISWKSAAVARDASNGTYIVHLTVPLLSNSSVQMTLSHYYTCYQGFTRTSNARVHKDYHQIDLGPVPVFPSPTFSALMSRRNEDHFAPSNFSEMANLPRKGVVALPKSLHECPANQLGMDQLTKGIWIDQTRDLFNGNCTFSATWVPTECRSPVVERLPLPSARHLLRVLNDNQQTGSFFQVFRVGDSTMPPQSLDTEFKWNMGDPFTPDYPGMRLKFHNTYMNILKNRLPTADASDVLVFSHGLHQLLISRYTVQTALESLLRMLCQMATMFRGKIVVQAPVPIQQQHFYRFDLTDANVNLLKAMLREKITAVNGKLSKLCHNIRLDVFYSAASSKGDFLPQEEALKVFENNFQFSLDVNATSEEVELERYFGSLSIQDQQSILGDRRVIYADAANFLRPRDECYRANDKIHAIRYIEGQSLMNTGHEELLKLFAALRAKMEK